MIPHWTDELVRLGACVDAVVWAREQPSLAAAWKHCQRGDWMLWLAGRLSGEPGSDARRTLVLAACDCAELSAHLATSATSDGQMAIALCLTIARDWADGGDSDLGDVALAGDVAWAARAPEAAWSAWVAWVAGGNAVGAIWAAGAASWVARAVAWAAGAPEAARATTLSACADIARRYYPLPPNGAILNGASLNGASLDRASLDGASLDGASLNGASLDGAILNGAILNGANLDGASLNGANLDRASLNGANLGNPGNPTIVWSSHALLSEILYRAAGDSESKQMLATYVAHRTDWCWEQWGKWEHPEKEWALHELALWVKNGDGAPEIVLAFAKKDGGE